MAGTHTVRTGDGLDNFWKISKHYGVSFQELKKINPELLGRRPKGDSQYGWLYPGDNVKLPPVADDDGPVCKIIEECPKKKVEVLAIKGPTPFRLCHPATFKVSSYKGTPGPDDKKRIKWLLRDGTTGDDLLKGTPPVAIENGDELQINCVPFDWHGKNIEVAAQFDKAPSKPMITAKPDSCELLDWIALIKKAELAYPKLTGVQMTASMRWVAGYDGAGFRKFYGGSMAGAHLKPAGPLTQSDINQLQTWTMHGFKGGTEVGIVKDFDGTTIAAGHVLTGLSGGVFRDRSIDITPGYAIGAGERMDNLYGVTISGDLGQAAVYVNESKQAKPYIGIHGEATEAELVGDIDGFLIGAAEPRGGSGRRLSATLLDYYCSCSAKGAKIRFSSFQSMGLGDLKDQIYRFASTYKYASEGALEGFVTEVETESNEAYGEFVQWLDAKVKAEKAGAGGVP